MHCGGVLLAQKLSVFMNVWSVNQAQHLGLVLGTPRDIALRSPKPRGKVDRKPNHFSEVEYMAIRDRCEKIWRLAQRKESLAYTGG